MNSLLDTSPNMYARQELHDRQGRASKIVPHRLRAVPLAHAPLAHHERSARTVLFVQPAAQACERERMWASRARPHKAHVRARARPPTHPRPPAEAHCTHARARRPRAGSARVRTGAAGCIQNMRPPEPAESEHRSKRACTRAAHRHNLFAHSATTAGRTPHWNPKHSRHNVGSAPHRAYTD